MNPVRRALAPGRALVAYFTAGAPDEGAFLEAAEGAVRAGAALLEIGLPSSAPFADGPLLQRSHAEALRRGTTFGRTLELAFRLRSSSPVPLVLLAYPSDLPDGNGAAQEAAGAGFQAILAPGLDGSAPSRLAPWIDAGLSPAALLRPSGDPIPPGWAGAFLYVARYEGPTGESRPPSGELFDLLDTLRLRSRLPLVAGFGVEEPSEAQVLWDHAEGVAVGSCLYRALLEDRQGDAGRAVYRKVRHLLSRIEESLEVCKERKP